MPDGWKIMHFGLEGMDLVPGRSLHSTSGYMTESEHQFERWHTDVGLTPAQPGSKPVLEKQALRRAD